MLYHINDQYQRPDIHIESVKLLLTIVECRGICFFKNLQWGQNVYEVGVDLFHF